MITLVLFIRQLRLPLYPALTALLRLKTFVKWIPDKIQRFSCGEKVLAAMKGGFGRGS